MGAREVIAKALQGWFDKNGFLSYENAADIAAYALTAAGYLILSPDEVRGMERDRQAVEFAARWCWRTDPPNAHNKLTDAERLGVIKHHPTVKKYGQPHIELAEREGLLKGGRDAQ